MEYIFDNYKFTVEEDNGNNILLEKLGDEHQHSVITAIKKFVIFLHQNDFQYVIIYDIKLRNRYANIIKYIYKNANNTEKWLYSLATFVEDEGKLFCKVY